MEYHNQPTIVTKLTMSTNKQDRIGT